MRQMILCVALLTGLAPAADEPVSFGRPVSTYSIVARDPAGEPT